MATEKDLSVEAMVGLRRAGAKLGVEMVAATEHEQGVMMQSKLGKRISTHKSSAKKEERVVKRMVTRLPSEAWHKDCTFS